jgi:hypothetical protein
VFRADEVADAADFDHPTEISKGIEAVYVNGQPVWDDNAPTRNYPGQVLKREAA